VHNNAEHYRLPVLPSGLATVGSFQRRLRHFFQFLARRAQLSSFFKLFSTRCCFDPSFFKAVQVGVTTSLASLESKESRNHLNRNDTIVDIILLPLRFTMPVLRASPPAAAPPRTSPRWRHQMHCLRHGRKGATYVQAAPPRCSANWRHSVKCITACTRY
jgi:hypothetical protein